jgi:hypothetical protein
MPGLHGEKPFTAAGELLPLLLLLKVSLNCGYQQNTHEHG